MKIAFVLLVLGALGFTANTLLGRGRSIDDSARTTFYANGRLEMRAECVDGQRQGPCERWHKNGEKQAEGQFADDRMSGVWHFWNVDATPDLDRSGTYERGVKIAD